MSPTATISRLEYPSYKERYVRLWAAEEEDIEPEDDRTPEQQDKDWEMFLLAVESNPMPEPF